MTCTPPASPKRPLTCTLPGTRASLCPSPEGAHDHSILGQGLPAPSLKDQIANISHFIALKSLQFPSLCLQPQSGPREHVYTWVWLRPNELLYTDAGSRLGLSCNSSALGGPGGARQGKHGGLQGCRAAERPHHPESLNSGQEYRREINTFFL